MLLSLVALLSGCVSSRQISEPASRKTLSTIHYDAAAGDLDAIKRHQQKGVNLDLLHPNDYATPLHEAAAGGHLAICKLLVGHGANVNPMDIAYMTPIDWALYFGNNHIEVADFLRRHGGKSAKELKAEGKLTGPDYKNEQ
jgi:ankyrin repeat protein